MKKERICIVVLLTLLATVNCSSHRQLQSTSYTITASRSSQMTSLCTSTDRNSLYSQYNLKGDIPYMSQFSNFFNLDSTVFDQFLDLDVIGINNSLRGNSLGYATYIAPAFIGPAFLILVAPLLLICLCCPSSCCLRKKLQYTSCEQMWPVLVTWILGGVVIGSCFAGLFSNYKLYDGYQKVGCSGIIGVDDAMYGAQSNTGDGYFAGIKTINTQLQNLMGGNLNYILGNLTSLSSTGNYTSQALSLMSTALYSISIIPDPTTNNLTLNYNTPLSSSTPNATIPSIFPAILGSQNSNSTLVGTAYSGMNQANTNLSSITSTVDSFKSSQSAFTSSLAQIINQTSESATLLKSTLITVKDIFASESYIFNVSYVQRLFYGVIIGLTIFYILILTIFSCCDKMSCRYLLYFLGFLIFWVALATFAVFFLLTYSSAIFNSGCNYLSATISNTTTFVTNLKKLGISETTAQQYSVCLAGQSGDIISQLSGQQNRNYLYSLQYVMTNITSFNGSYLTNLINSSYQPLPIALSPYANAQTLDITDSSSISELKYVSSSNNFNCSVGDFAYDSWIPSIHQTDNAIPCQSPTGMPNSDNSTCTSVSDFNNATSNCQGCMDTFSLLYNATSQATAASILSGRYPGCNIFNNELANIWQNYYLIKKNVLGPVTSREYTARQSAQTVTQSITNNLVPTFQNTINQIYQTSSSVLTPNYGMLWGLNCHIVGEDMSLFQQVACTNTFSYSYFHRIICAIISFGLLFLLCCNTCSIFRRSKDIIQSNNAFNPQRNRAAPYGDPQSSARLHNNYL